MIYPPNYPKCKMFADIAKVAEEDLWDYFGKVVFASGNCDLDWKEVLKEIQKENPKKDSWFSGCTDAIEFVGLLLAWLAETKYREQPLWPWVFNENHNLKINNNKINDFMENLKFVLDALCFPEERYNMSYIKPAPCMSFRLLHFMEYVAKTKIDPHSEWFIVTTPVPSEYESVLKGKVSYLIIDSSKKVLFIIYAMDKIKKGALNELEVAERLEKTILHEVGRARTNLIDWYLPMIMDKEGQANLRKWWLGSIADRPLIMSPAVHEFMAWAYAFSVRSCLKSFRSWITMLFKEVDDEWKN